LIKSSNGAYVARDNK
jgi:hypothetical protein